MRQESTIIKSKLGNILSKQELCYSKTTKRGYGSRKSRGLFRRRY